MIKIENSDQLNRYDYSDVAVILPAHNEEVGVASTVKSFIQTLPGCTVVVCNNASTDSTAEAAIHAGALVIDEPTLGKGNAVRRLLATVDAKIYVMSDADTTYDAGCSREMIALLERQHLDMVTGVRLHTKSLAYRPGHILGNIVFNRLFDGLFKTKTRDVFSGYRVFSERFVHALPLQAKGFEVEAEISAIAAILRISVGEVQVGYSPRLAGSTSKLKTYRDGFRILLSYIRILRHFHPKRFYGFLALIIGAASLFFGAPVLLTYLESGLVPRFPTAVLASSLGTISALIFLTGILLEAIAKSRIEQRQLFFMMRKS
jgi:glycosyltransferase involved in cell wall biosynthesis